MFAVQDLNFRFYLLLSLARMMQQQPNIEMDGVSDKRVLYSLDAFLNDLNRILLLTACVKINNAQ